MKNATLLLCTLFAFSASFGQDDFNPRKLDHEVSFDAEAAFSKVQHYFLFYYTNDNPLLLNKKGEYGFGLNYKHKVIQKGNYSIHLGFNSGFIWYDYQVSYDSGFAPINDFVLLRNKFRMAFGKEWYLLNSKLIIEPIVNLTYRTFIYSDIGAGHGYSYENPTADYDADLDLEMGELRRMYPQLQLNLNYRLFNRLHAGLTFKTGLFEYQVYRYKTSSSVQNPPPINSTNYTENQGYIELKTRNLYLGFNIAFKY